MRRVTYLSAWLALVVFLFAGCASSRDPSDGDQSSERVQTCVEQTLVPDPVPDTPVRIDDVESIVRLGYGTYRVGPGLPYQTRTDLMPEAYQAASVKRVATLLRFFTLTDIHLTDEESPAQGIVFAPMLGKQGVSLYAPLMPYTTQVLDAVVQTVNAYHRQHRLDLGLVLGDITNTGQYNELRWFIDIMDGKTIAPYSGGRKDPVSGPNNDFADEFDAAGIDPSIPWYAAIGNHDHFWIGSKRFSEDMRRAVIGEKILQLPHVLKDDGFIYSTGTLDGGKPNAPIIGAGRVDQLTFIPTVVADPDRRYVSRDEWMREFANTTSWPRGHGFAASVTGKEFNGCYSFLPKSDIPLKIIVLDDTQSDDDPPYQEGIYGHGSLDRGRYEWLMGQLQSSQEANQLMVIAAHIPIGVMGDVSPMSWLPVPGAYSTQAELIERLKAFPNLVLMVAGHRHLNTVTGFASADPAHPENGFWQVETKSLREFPEQFRVFEIVLNDDMSLSIVATDVDPVMKEGSQAAQGRAYAIAANQIYGLDQIPAHGVFNVILYKQVTPVMREVLARCINK